MTIKNLIKKAWKNPIDIFHYLVGNYRYHIYYSKYFKWLIRTHIKEQIDWRIKWMDKDCYDNGECKLCGCATTALQMANKSCKKPCYPYLMNKQEWDNYFKHNYTHVQINTKTKQIKYWTLGINKKPINV